MFVMTAEMLARLVTWLARVEVQRRSGVRGQGREDSSMNFLHYSLADSAHRENGHMGLWNLVFAP